MKADDETGTLVGIFGEPARARSAAEALRKAGFPHESIRLVEPLAADAELLAELSGDDVDEWRAELASGGSTLVAISMDRRADARAILAAHGAVDVVDDDDPRAANAPPDSGEADSRASTSAPSPEIRPGMLLAGSDYAPVGRVKRIEGDEVLVDRRPMRRDVWLPLNEVARRIGNWGVMTMPADQVDLMEPFVRPRIGERTVDASRTDDGERA